VLLLPFVFVSVWIIFIIKRLGGKRLPVTDRILYRTGVFPTRDAFFKTPEQPEYLNKKNI
jgi:hypothetical protein